MAGGFIKPQDASRGGDDLNSVTAASDAPPIAMRTRPGRLDSGPSDAGNLVGAALRRIRILVGILILIQAAGQGLARAEPAREPSLAMIAIAVIGVVLIVNFISAAGDRASHRRVAAMLGAAELAADTTLVLGVVTLVHIFNPEVIWAILVVPVLEGALRYRLRGAFLTWIAVSAGYLAFVWHEAMLVNGADISGAVLTDLETSIQRLGVILLAAIPAGYLSEQLLIAISAQRRERELAARRGEMLETVARTAQQISRLESNVLGSITVGLDELGFDATDLVVREGSIWLALGRWSADADVLLPPPELPSGGIEAAQNHGRMVLVEREHADQRELEGLVTAGLETVVTVPLDGLDGFMLRAGVREGSKLGTDQAECMGLLARQLGVALRNGTLLDDLRGMHDQLRHQAFHDQLTGLANRARFMSALGEALDERNHAASVAVLFLDLDRFKRVNDVFGHDVGDQLLIKTAQRLSKCVRGRDLVARLGGDEFTMLVQNYEGDAPRAIAERVHAALSDSFDLAGHSVDIGTSIGIAKATGNDVMDAGELVRRADMAMYQEKQHRLDGWRYYASDVDDVAGRVDSLRLEAELSRAIEADEITIAFDPIVSMAGVPIAWEASPSWTHPTLGDVSQHSLVALVEQAGLISKFGRWLLSRTCTIALGWHDQQYGSAPMVCTNLSPLFMRSEDFVAVVDEVLAHTGIEQSRVMLGITEESVAIGDALHNTLTTLRSKGFVLALDHFGEGHASLQHLAHLPLDFLKLDQRLFRGDVSDPRGLAVIRSVVRLAHELGLKVVGLSVDEAEDFDSMRESGFDFVQGLHVNTLKTVEGRTLQATLQA